jgi:hypothetical protein
MPLNKRFILQVPKLTDPSNHQPTKASDTYLDPIARLQNSVPNTPASNSDKPPGTLGNVPEQDAENTGTPYGTRAERLEGMLAEILAGTVETAVFAPESPLEQQDKLDLAKLIIDLDLAIEKTIWLLWRVRRGGRNHNLYTEARAMLDRLWRGDGNEK